ncbi:Zinc finger CCCH domain-containing protein 14 [Bienertia sinuspersici]
MEDYYNNKNNNNDDDYASEIIISNNINNYCLFSSSTTSSTSPPSTPSAGPSATDPAGPGLYRARLILENHLYDELLNRYKLAITRLRELTRDATTLQKENEMLRLANDDLVRRLNRVLPVSDQPNNGGRSINSSNGSNDNDNIGNNTESPTSTVIDDEDDDNEEEGERVTLPKSISVRSPGFFKLLNLPSTNAMNQPPQANAAVSFFF